jgi:hypothetical protein
VKEFRIVGFRVVLFPKVIPGLKRHGHGFAMEIFIPNTTELIPSQPGYSKPGCFNLLEIRQNSYL